MTRRRVMGTTSAPDAIDIIDDQIWHEVEERNDITIDPLSSASSTESEASDDIYGIALALDDEGEMNPADQNIYHEGEHIDQDPTFPMDVDVTRARPDSEIYDLEEDYTDQPDDAHLYPEYERGDPGPTSTPNTDDIQITRSVEVDGPVGRSQYY